MLADFFMVFDKLFSLPHSLLLLCTESTVWAGSSSEKNPVRWQPYWYLNCWTYCWCKTLVVSILVADIHTQFCNNEWKFICRLLRMKLYGQLRIRLELLRSCTMAKTVAWNSGRFLTVGQNFQLQILLLGLVTSKSSAWFPWCDGVSQQPDKVHHLMPSSSGFQCTHMEESYYSYTWWHLQRDLLSPYWSQNFIVWGKCIQK